MFAYSEAVMSKSRYTSFFSVKGPPSTDGAVVGMRASEGWARITLVLSSPERWA